MYIACKTVKLTARALKNGVRVMEDAQKLLLQKSLLMKLN